MKFVWSRIKHIFKNSAREVLGIILVVFGIIGLFVPILQGILMIAFGLTLLGVKHVKEKFIVLKNKIKHWF